MLTTGARRDPRARARHSRRGLRFMLPFGACRGKTRTSERPPEFLATMCPCLYRQPYMRRGPRRSFRIPTRSKLERGRLASYRPAFAGTVLLVETGYELMQLLIQLDERRGWPSVRPSCSAIGVLPLPTTFPTPRPRTPTKSPAGCARDRAGTDSGGRSTARRPPDRAGGSWGHQRAL